MGRIAALVLVLAAALAAGCSKKTIADDCLAGKVDFIKSLRETFAQRVAGVSPEQTSDARAFFDKKAATAEANFDAYCKAVTDEDWKCMHVVVEAGGPPSPSCKPAADRFMKQVMDESDPDYH